MAQHNNTPPGGDGGCALESVLDLFSEELKGRSRRPDTTRGAPSLSRAENRTNRPTRREELPP